MPPELVLRSLRHVWLVLTPLGLPMAVMGGIALAAWKHVRATKDIDLLLGIGRTDLGQVLAVLEAGGIHPKQDPPIVSLEGLDVVPLLYEPPDAFMDLQIDLLLAKSSYHLQAIERRVSLRLPDLDIDVDVLTCEDLVLHKLLAGRILDRMDAAALLRANRNSLDREYLAKWITELQLATLFAEAWAEALPNEPLPGSPGNTR